MFGNSTGMFNTGGFGSGSVFQTGTGLGTSVSLGGNPLLGGLVCMHSSTTPYEGAFIDMNTFLIFEVDY
jgi:hypothetical protein